MAKEQVDRAVNDTSYKYGGIAKNPDLQAFWIERVAALLVYLCYWVPPDVEESFLIVAVDLLVLSNSLYLISFISSDIFVWCESMAEELPSDVNRKKYAFWMERVAAILVLYSYYSANVNHLCRHFLLPAVLLHTISTSIYLATYVATHMDTQESGKDKNETDKKKNEQEKAKFDFRQNESKEEVEAKDGRNKRNEENTGEEKASSKESKEEVKAKDGRNKRNEENTGEEKASSKESKEEVKAKDQRNNKVDEESTGQEKAKLDFSSKGSKEEVKAKDEGNNEIDDKYTRQKKAELEAKDGRNNSDEETSGQQKTKFEVLFVSLKELKVSLKELKEEVRRSSEKFESSEAKRLAKIKKRVDRLRKSFDKFHGWEEERSQLMHDLGAARASMEIYRDLLHDLHDLHQP